MSLCWESYHEINNLLLSVHRCFNSGDFDGMGAIFEHATLTTIYPWHPEKLVAQGGPRIGDGYRRATRLYDGLPRVQYTLTNALIEGDDTQGKVTSSSQYFAIFGDESTWNQPHSADAEPHDTPPIQIFIAGRYEDTFARMDGRWRFTSRTCHADFTGDRSVHLANDPLKDRANTDLRSK